MDEKLNGAAQMLVRSLTDADTRGEWVRTFESHYLSCATTYRNEKRDLTVVRRYAYSGGIGWPRKWITTPFSLSRAEERLVRDATKAFDRYEQEQSELAAMERLRHG